MKMVCNMIGGSHSYGLNTPSSDIDYRGVFVNTNYKHILGLEQHQHQKEENGDTMHYELRRFVELLRKGNTQALELLFNKKWVLIDQLFNLRFCEERRSFLDSEQIYKCLRGYSQHELSLAMGMRPGVIGHKRAEQVRKYGFSPKNFCQLFRLLLVGKYFFNTGEIIVDTTGFPSKEDHRFLLDVKTNPQNYTCNQLRSLYDEYQIELDKSFNSRTETFKFDYEYACDCVLKTYTPPLHEAYLKVIS